MIDNSLPRDKIGYQEAAKIIIGVLHESVIVGQITLTETRSFFESIFIFLLEDMIVELNEVANCH